MLTRWNDIERMFGAMDMLRDRMNRLFGDFDRGWGVDSGWLSIDSWPKANLYDNGDAFEVMAEVPGVSKEDLNIRIQGNYLEISGTRMSDRPEGYAAHRVERGTTTFSRSFTLPLEVAVDKVDATLTVKGQRN